MPISDQISSKIQDAFAPEFFYLENESHQHNVPKDSSTHFKLICVSSAFQDISKVKRHQAVYAVLAEELSAGVHALAMHLYSPAEWDETGEAPNSPKCMGGTGK